MQDRIDDHERRLKTLEAERVSLLERSKRIEDNTQELLTTFNALKGAWTVLNFIGKLAKPLAVLAAAFGFYFSVKGTGK
jgi:hypothetical protein